MLSFYRTHVRLANGFWAQGAQVLVGAEVSWCGAQEALVSMRRRGPSRLVWVCQTSTRRSARIALLLFNEWTTAIVLIPSA